LEQLLIASVHIRTTSN